MSLRGFSGKGSQVRSKIRRLEVTPWTWNAFGVLCAALALVASVADYFQNRNENAAFAETLAVLGVAADTATLKHDDQDRIIQGIINSGAASSLARVDLLAAEVEHWDEESARIEKELGKVVSKATTNREWVMAARHDVATFRGLLPIALQKEFDDARESRE